MKRSIAFIFPFVVAVSIIWTFTNRPQTDAALDAGCISAVCEDGCKKERGEEVACEGTCTYYPFEPPYIESLPKGVDFFSCAKQYRKSRRNVVLFTCFPAKSDEPQKTRDKIWCNESSFKDQEPRYCYDLVLCWCEQPEKYFENYCIEDPNTGEYIACSTVQVPCSIVTIVDPEPGDEDYEDKLDTDDCDPNCLHCCMQGDCSGEAT